jgi:hypothetical protein
MGQKNIAPLPNITRGERTGAGILTFFMILGILGTAWFMLEG